MPTIAPRLRFNAGLLPPPPQPSPFEQRLTSFLNGGAPAAPTDDWTEEDYQLAAMTGDPMGVRAIYDQIMGRHDEDQFIRDISAIDWKGADRNAKLRDVFAKNPRAAMSRDAMSLMDFYRKLGEEESPSTPQVSDSLMNSIANEGAEALGLFRKVLGETNDPFMAKAAVADWKAKQRPQDDGRSLPVADGRQLLEMANSVATAGDTPVDYSGTKDDPYIQEVVALAGATFDDARKWTEKQWNDAKANWSRHQREKKLDEYRKVADDLRKLGYAIPQELRPEGFAPTPQPVSQQPPAVGVPQGFVPQVTPIPQNAPPVPMSGPIPPQATPATPNSSANRFLRQAVGVH